jgi:hypothetical protein
MTSKPRRIAKLSPALLALIGLVFLAAGAATWFLWPAPKFTARIQLHIALEQPFLLFRQEMDPLQNESYLRKQMQHVKDRFSLSAALREPEIAKLSIVKEQPDPLRWLEQEIKVELPNPETMTISLSGDHRDELTKIVNEVAHTYWDRYCNKEHKDREAFKARLEKLEQKLKNELKGKRTTLKTLQDRTGSINEESVVLLQQIAQEELLGVKKQIAEVRHQLLVLSVELSLHPDWLEQVWPQYAAALNGLPGTALPVNQAVVGLLHDDVHLLMQMPKADRLQKQEKYRHLKAMERALLEDAMHLTEKTKQNRKDVTELVEMVEEIDQHKKLVQKVNDRLIQMDVEREAPPRIDEPAKDAILCTPNETNYKTMRTGGAATLAGLGILLLFLALFEFLFNQAFYPIEHLSTIPSPE